MRWPCLLTYVFAALWSRLRGLLLIGCTEASVTSSPEGPVIAPRPWPSTPRLARNKDP